jgi:hypothetical protein
VTRFASHTVVHETTPKERDIICSSELWQDNHAPRSSGPDLCTRYLCVHAGPNRTCWAHRVRTHGRDEELTGKARRRQGKIRSQQGPFAHILLTSHTTPCGSLLHEACAFPAHGLVHPTSTARLPPPAVAHMLKLQGGGGGFAVAFPFRAQRSHLEIILTISLARLLRRRPG